MDISHYISTLNYIYEHEYINLIGITILLAACAVLWIILLLMPKISQKNKIEISVIAVVLVSISIFGVIYQKRMVDNILLDIQTESFTEYEGEFDFTKNSASHNDYHIVDVSEQDLSLQVFNFLTQPEYVVLKENIENGRHQGRIIYGANSKLIVYISVNELP